MSGIKILATGRAVPEQVIDNHWFAERMDTNDEWITSRTGIKTRHFCKDETHTELCVKAAEQALKNSGITAEQIGLCIVATVTADMPIPASACMVSRALNLAEDSLCFDLNSACTGFLYALHTAECLLSRAQKKYALIIGGEVLSRAIDFSDRGTAILFGDGAGAVVAQWSESAMPMHCSVGVRGDNNLLAIKSDVDGEMPSIKMEGTAVFKFALEVVPKCMNDVLERAKLTMEDIDFFVFHQANARIIDLVAKKYHIPEEKYYKNIQNYGNTSAASIPIVLSELSDMGKIAKGSLVLCVGFGGGLTWGGGLITIG